MPFGIFSWNRNLPNTHQSGIQVQSKHSSSRISIHLARGEVENFQAHYYCKQIVHCMLFEAEGVSDLIICILSNQITCTTAVCLVQGCETTAKNRNENFAMPKATQVATGSFLFSNRPRSFSCWFLPIQTNILRKWLLGEWCGYLKETWVKTEQNSYFDTANEIFRANGWCRDEQMVSGSLATARPPKFFPACRVDLDVAAFSHLLCSHT